MVKILRFVVPRLWLNLAISHKNMTKEYINTYPGHALPVNLWIHETQDRFSRIPQRRDQTVG